MLLSASQGIYCIIYPDMRYTVHFSRTRSVWIIYWHRCLCKQPRKYKQLQMYNRRDLLLYSVIITAV